MKKILIITCIFLIALTNINLAWTYVTRIADEQLAPGELIVYIITQEIKG